MDLNDQGSHGNSDFCLTQLAGKLSVVFAPYGRGDAHLTVGSGEWAGMTRPVAAVLPAPPARLDVGPSASLFISMINHSASGRRAVGMGAVLDINATTLEIFPRKVRDGSWECPPRPGVRG